MATATSVAADAVTSLAKGSSLIKMTQFTLSVLRQPLAISTYPSRPSDTISLAATGTTPPQSRLLDLQKKQCDIFGTTYNPDRMRLGNKVLRQRLKGPILSAYYPRKAVTIADIQKEFKRYGLETYNEDEEDRLEGLQIAKLRGKGAPKKKRTADTTKKGRKKK